MLFEVIDIVIFAVALIANALYFYFILSSGNYDKLIMSLDSKKYPVFVAKEVYGVGYKVIEKFRINMKSKYTNEIRAYVNILFDEKYCDFYINALCAERISVSALLFVIMSDIACFASGTDKIVMLFLAAIIAGLVYYYYLTWPKKEMKKLETRLLKDLPEAVSTFTLFINANMPIRRAWYETAKSGTGELYRMMMKCSEEMEANQSMSFDVAMHRFGIKCGSNAIRKFVSLLAQENRRGGGRLSSFLSEQSDAFWFEKKQNILKKGDVASSKLIIPLGLMFLGVLALIIGPVLSGFSI